jgi:hypothetical protein
MPPRRTLARKAIRFANDILIAGYGPPEQRIECARFSDFELPVTLATITGHRDLPQAIASIISFRTLVGRPVRVFITDDGTLTHEDREVVSLLGPEARVHEPAFDPRLPCADLLACYAETAPLGRKLAMLIELTSSGSAALVYADSDVLFISPDHLRTVLTEPVEAPRYMTDPNRMAVDSRIDTRRLKAVNSGFLVLPADMNWNEALETCGEALQVPEWYTEQTVVSVAVNGNRGVPLPPDQYVLRWDDRRGLRDRTGPAAVLRHYVAPVRWRFWIRAHGGYGPAFRRSLPPLGRLIGESLYRRIRSTRL